MTNNTRFIRRGEVEKRTGLTTSTLYDMMARSEFPKPIRLGPRIVAWIEDEIQEWMDARIASARNGVKAA